MGNDPFERVWEMNYLSSGDEEHKCDSTMTWNEVWKYYNLIYLLLVEEKNKRTPQHLSYSPTVEPLICQRQFSWSLSSPQISMIPALWWWTLWAAVSFYLCHRAEHCRIMALLIHFVEQWPPFCVKGFVSNQIHVLFTPKFDQLRQNNTLCELIISFMFFCFCVCVCMFVKAIANSHFIESSNLNE